MADIEKSYVGVKTFIVSLIAVASATMTGTVAWMTVVHANARVEYINERLDKITKRNASSIEEVSERVSKLELPNSDQ